MHKTTTTTGTTGDSVVVHQSSDEAPQNEADEDDDLCGLVNTDEYVQEALDRARIHSDIAIELLPTDIKEDKVVSDFMSIGCGCKKGIGGKPCSTQFSQEYLVSTRQSCAELSRSELDLVILGELFACTNRSSGVVTSSRHTAGERERSSTAFCHQGRPVCVKTFRILHGIGEKKFKNLMKSLKEDGLAPRVHQNTKRKPHNALSFTSVEYVIRFLLTYTEQNALLLPGRVPGYSRADIKLLPSSVSKRGIWRVYHAAAEVDDTIHAVAYSTFCKLWNTLLPSVVIMKPMTDLCAQCHRNSGALLRAANLPESEKSAAIQDAQEHLRVVQLERSFYKTTCDECQKSVTTQFTIDGQFIPPSPLSAVLPVSTLRVHYSFDYAQQVHFPSDPMQPGPIYFLTPRKCTVFGVNCEAIPRQINFLTDEAGDCGKGGNAVISRLHYFFDHHSLGEREVFLHADNCTGQNKNNIMIQYLVWRTLTDRHSDITLSFLVVGHTKFAPDWCFGLFKRLYRRTKIGSLKDIARVANTSAECNFAQLVCQEDGTTIVPTYDWASFLAPHLKKLPAIKKFHHFRMSTSKPGVIFCKKHSDLPEEEFDINKHSWSPDKDDLPSVIPPRGLSADRQWYLYEQIRPYCPDEDKDTTCPKPTVPKPGRSTPGPEQESSQPGPPKRKRTCTGV